MSFKWIIANWDLAWQWLQYMAAGRCQSPTFKPLFVAVRNWMTSKKLKADVQFVLAYCEIIEHVMAFVTAVAPWMLRAKLSPCDQHGGFRAAEWSVRIVILHRDLCDLNIRKDARFQAFRDVISECSDGDQQNGWQQADVFVDEALAKLEKHSERWLTKLLPFSLAFEEAPWLAYYLALSMLAMWDREPAPAIDPTHEFVDLYGEKWKMCEVLQALLEVLELDLRLWFLIPTVS